MESKLLNFILENASAYIIQEAVKEFNIKGIGYKMRQQIINEFPEYRNNQLLFGVALSNALSDFKVEEIILVELNLKITAIQNKMRILGKWHPDYLTLCKEHDVMVTVNNELNKPITKFLKLYKKAQRLRGEKISVVKKKERFISKPV